MGKVDCTGSVCSISITVCVGIVHRNRSQLQDFLIDKIVKTNYFSSTNTSISVVRTISKLSQSPTNTGDPLHLLCLHIGRL